MSRRFGVAVPHEVPLSRFRTVTDVKHPGRFAFYETLPSFAVPATRARKAIKLTPVQAAPIDDSEIPF